MARPGRLRNKVLFFLLLLLVVGCGQRRNIPGSGAEPVVPAVYVNEASGGFQLDSGILVRNGIPFTGYVFALNDRGDTLAVTPFYRGKEHGISRAYYPGGKIREMREFSLGKKIGIHRGWWPNGKLKFEYHFANDLYEGAVTEWFEDGSVYRLFHYHCGQESGLQTMYYADGRVQANYEARNGRNYGNTGFRNCENPIRKDAAAVSAR